MPSPQSLEMDSPNQSALRALSFASPNSVHKPSPAQAHSDKPSIALQNRQILPATHIETEILQLVENKATSKILIETKPQVNFSGFQHNFRPSPPLSHHCLGLLDNRAPEPI